MNSIEKSHLKTQLQLPCAKHAQLANPGSSEFRPSGETQIARKRRKEKATTRRRRSGKKPNPNSWVGSLDLTIPLTTVRHMSSFCKPNFYILIISIHWIQLT